MSNITTNNQNLTEKATYVRKIKELRNIQSQNMYINTNKILIHYKCTKYSIMYINMTWSNLECA